MGLLDGSAMPTGRQSIAAVSRVKLSADGHGVVSQAGVGMLRELAELTGAAPLTPRLTVAYRHSND
jgi:hypothetical protein